MHIHINKYFACRIQNCISYENVCNLANDCGDDSDEEICTNNFRCVDSGEYVPLTAKCDSKLDCHDFSDECNADYPKSERYIFGGVFLKATSWIIGLLALILNLIIVTSSILSIGAITSFQGRLNKLFREN